MPVIVLAVATPPNVRFASAASVSSPPVDVDRVTLSAPVAASGSVKFTADRSTLLNTSSVTLMSVTRPVAPGLSLLAVILIVCDAESSSLDPSAVNPGSAPVFPPSLTVSVMGVEADGVLLLLL